jgi:hypothetical protein
MARLQRGERLKRRLMGGGGGGSSDLPLARDLCSLGELEGVHLVDAASAFIMASAPRKADRHERDHREAHTARDLSE